MKVTTVLLLVLLLNSQNRRLKCYKNLPIIKYFITTKQKTKTGQSWGWVFKWVCPQKPIGSSGNLPKCLRLPVNK